MPTAIIKKIEKPFDGFCCLQLEVKSSPFLYKAGQHIGVQWHGENRLYSIAGMMDSNTIELHLKLTRTGGFTDYIGMTAKIGEHLDITEAQGSAVYTPDMQKLTLIGGGTGAAPLLPIIREAQKNKADIEVLCGHPNGKESAFYKDHLINIGIADDRLHMIAEYDETGLVQTGLITDLLDRVTLADDRDYFIYGSPEMVRAVAGWLLREGISLKRIHSDCEFIYRENLVG